MQVVVDRKTRQILCVAIGPGREHDFKLYKRSKLAVHKASELLADKGYQGTIPYRDRPPMAAVHPGDSQAACEEPNPQAQATS